MTASSTTSNPRFQRRRLTNCRALTGFLFFFWRFLLYFCSFLANRASFLDIPRVFSRSSVRESVPSTSRFCKTESKSSRLDLLGAFLSAGFSVLVFFATGLAFGLVTAGFI